MSITIPERLAILREKLDAFNVSTLDHSRADARISAWAVAMASREHLPAVLALPYHLDDSAVIAIEGHRGNGPPVVTAYPDGKGGWRVVGYLARYWVERPVATRAEVLRLFAESGCTLAEVLLRAWLKLLKAAEGGSNA